MEGLDLEGNNAIEPVADKCCANLPVSRTDTEAQVLSKERWEEIRRLHTAGNTVSAMARLLELDRKTVRYWMRQETWEPYQRPVVGNTVLDAHRDWLAARAAQVNFSARILFQELKAAHGYQGGYDTVKLAVRPLRAEASLAMLTQRRFETAPGQQAQIDWGQTKVKLGGTPATIHFFVMTLGYSRRAYVEAFADEQLASLLAAHEHAFAHFGGHCAELLYDRMRTVVLGTEDGKPKWNCKFDAFAKYWGFEARLCRPYRAQTKGKVESGVKYVKRNFMPGRDFRDVNDQLLRWSVEVADLRMHGTTHQRPIDRFADEASCLVPTTRQASFLDALVRERVVAEDWLVTIDTNRYSVPCRLVGKTVQIVRVGGIWQMQHGGKVVAEHAILSGRDQLSVQSEHGPGAAARNARQRFPEPGPASTAPVIEQVEVRDLHIYEQLLEVV
jgi:transposase